VQGGGEDTQYSWNPFGELTGVTGAASRQFRYDALGRLVDEGGSTKVHWFGSQRIARLKNGFDVHVLHHGDGPDEPLMQSRFYLPLPGLLVPEFPPSDSYVHTGPTGSPTFVFYADGTLAGDYRFTAYGEPLPSPMLGGDAWLQYQGHQQLVDVGLVSMRARWYRPDLGRFLSPDPLDLADGSNRYRFAGSSPLDHRDPTGLKKWFDSLHVGMPTEARDAFQEQVDVFMDDQIGYFDRGVALVGAFVATVPALTEGVADLGVNTPHRALHNADRAGALLAHAIYDDNATTWQRVDRAAGSVAHISMAGMDATLVGGVSFKVARGVGGLFTTANGGTRFITNPAGATLDLHTLQGLARNPGTVVVGRGGAGRPLTGPANSFSITDGGHALVYGPEGRLMYDVSASRIKAFQWNQAANGNWFPRTGSDLKFPEVPDWVLSTLGLR
jgi:RHS repeat-associated protein